MSRHGENMVSGNLGAFIYNASFQNNTQQLEETDKQKRIIFCETMQRRIQVIRRLQK